MSLEVFTRQYIDTALWSSTDDNDEPLDNGDHELSDEARKTLEDDARKFYEANCADIILSNVGKWADDSLSQAGHDFWLTRNGHGAGFWDGDWPEPLATQLDKASKAFGECNLYVGDDGLIYTI